MGSLAGNKGEHARRTRGKQAHDPEVSLDQHGQFILGQFAKAGRKPAAGDWCQGMHYLNSKPREAAQN